MAKTIILIHGRNYKPPKDKLAPLWIQALRHGLGRDLKGTPSHAAKLAAFDAALRRASADALDQFVYYGDLSNAYLEFGKDWHSHIGQSTYDDSEERQKQLDLLRSYPTATDFSRSNYRKLPGQTGVGEFFADTLGAALGSIGLGRPLITFAAPDMERYFRSDSRFGTEVRGRLIAPLRAAMDRGDDICVISHSLGTLISYDTFWKFNYYSEYRGTLTTTDYSHKRISLWITLGSPLGDETCKRHLKGADLTGPRRYPANIDRWVNVFAEDDYVSHDGKVKNDYKGMSAAISDHKVYNLGLEFGHKGFPHGRSNPHSELGYLIHPEVARVVADWL
ncbi:MAG: hypothetical protein FJY67_03235 [Calditrichaeota bacterium]|nr:hypothetical protein [Calditrichota bacterium]